MEKLHIIAIATFFFLTACEGVPSYAPPVTKDTDKQLNCSQLELEINEAELYKKSAMENRGFSLRNLFSPFRYPDTAIKAGDAIAATDQRMDYLKQVHAIKRCGDPNIRMQEAQMRQHAPAAPTSFAATGTFNAAPVMAPQPALQQPIAAPTQVPAWPEQPPASAMPPLPQPAAEAPSSMQPVAEQQEQRRAAGYMEF